MKASKKLNIAVKGVIDSNEGEYNLREAVTVEYDRYMGYNYLTQQHEYAKDKVLITKVARFGKKGVVYVSDVYNNYFKPSEITESECEAILRQIA